MPDGGKVAVIEGQAGVFAAGQRTGGFTDTITKGGKFEVVASVPAIGTGSRPMTRPRTILQQHPDLVGVYANNDGMALGVVEAVKAAGLQDKVKVFGTDGISDAYASIRAGELDGTVDSFPVLTGEVAMDVALRLLGGQDLPRVVATPQALVTQENVETYSVKGDQLRAVLEAEAKRRRRRTEKSAPGGLPAWLTLKKLEEDRGRSSAPASCGHLQEVWCRARAGGRFADGRARRSARAARRERRGQVDAAEGPLGRASAQRGNDRGRRPADRTPRPGRRQASAASR